MGAVEWVIVGIVFVWVAVALFFVIRAKKKGKSCACGGCSSCKDCSSCSRGNQGCARCAERRDDRMKK